MARNFTGPGGYISFGATKTQVSTSYTVSAWANAASTSAGMHTVFALGVSAGYSTQLRRTGANWEFYQLGTGDTLAGEVGGVTSGIWNQLAGLWNGSNIYFYRNGILKGGPTAIATLSRPQWTQNCWGRYVDGTGAPWDGLIADGAIWNVALTVDELLSLASGVRPWMVRPNALIGYWPLDGLQSPEPDLSGIANNGTVSGTVLLGAGPPITMFTPRWPRNYDPVVTSPLSQTHFRFRTDTNAVDATPTWGANEDTDGYNPDVNKFRIRTKIEKVN